MTTQTNLHFAFYILHSTLKKEGGGSDAVFNGMDKQYYFTNPISKRIGTTPTEL